MPDHLHVLARGVDETSNAIHFIQRFKQTSGYDFVRENGHRLWQQSFYDHVLRSDEDVIAIAGYIVANPVRAGLVEDAEAWPYSGGSLMPRQDGAEAPSLRAAEHTHARA